MPKSGNSIKVSKGVEVNLRTREEGVEILRTRTYFMDGLLKTVRFFEITFWAVSWLISSLVTTSHNASIACTIPLSR